MKRQPTLNFTSLLTVSFSTGVEATEADKGHELSLPSCRFQVVASKLSLPSCRFHSWRDIFYYNVRRGEGVWGKL